MQDFIAQKIKDWRCQQGALEIDIDAARPVVKGKQVVAAVKETRNRAKEIIENLMIVTNLASNQFLKKLGYPRLSRIVKTPKNWPCIVEIAESQQYLLPIQPNASALNEFLKIQKQTNPNQYSELSLSIVKLLGRSEYIALANGDEAVEHFGLNLKDYSHITAPNRRFIDLAMSRLIKAAIKSEPSPYLFDELQKISEICSRKEADAGKIERKLNKCAIARLLVNRVGENFSAIVTGASEKGVWVKILAIPVEGKLVKNNVNVKVGDKISVKLIHVNPLEGFIDFEKI